MKSMKTLNYRVKIQELNGRVKNFEVFRGGKFGTLPFVGGGKFWTLPFLGVANSGLYFFLNSGT